MQCVWWMNASRASFRLMFGLVFVITSSQDDRPRFVCSVQIANSSHGLHTF